MARTADRSGLAVHCTLQRATEGKADSIGATVDVLLAPLLCWEGRDTGPGLSTAAIELSAAKVAVEP